MHTEPKLTQDEQDRQDGYSGSYGVLTFPDGTTAPFRPKLLPCDNCGVPSVKKVSLLAFYEGYTNLFPHMEGKASIHACEACINAAQAKREEQQQQEKAQRTKDRMEKQWDRLCPPLYRGTNLSRLPAAGVSAMEKHLAADGNDGLGLAFIGAPGKGKTRLLFEIARRIHFRGGDVMAISATEFSSRCQRMFMGSDEQREKAVDFMESLKGANYLMVDDIGKQRFTERVEMEFYGLLESRTSNMLPTYWTANAAGDQLCSMMSVDRGEAILRRLFQFSNVIKL